MTVQELYEWARQNNATDLEIALQFQDDGGLYSGNTLESSCEISASLVKSRMNKKETLYVLLS